MKQCHDVYDLPAVCTRPSHPQQQVRKGSLGSLKLLGGDFDGRVVFWVRLSKEKSSSVRSHLENLAAMLSKEGDKRTAAEE